MRRSGRTTKMLINIAQYIAERGFNDEKKTIILASYSVKYSMELLKSLYCFFPNAKRFAYTSLTIGNVIIRPFNVSDLSVPEIRHGHKWDKIFIDHYDGDLHV